MSTAPVTIPIPPSAHRRRLVRLMGLPIDPVSSAQAVNRIIDGVAAGEGGVVATPNVDHLRRYTEDPAIRDYYEQVDMSLADGMPLVWACRLQGTPVPGRVAGSDLAVILAERAAETGASIYLLGGDPGVADTAGNVLRANYPGINICGCHCPPYGFDRHADEMARVEAELTRTRPDIVYLGLSFPRSLTVALALSQRFPHTWFLGLGITLSFLAGDVQRAPLWARVSGLEWIHRLVQEPRRLARRYLVDGLPFALSMMSHALAARGSRGRRSRSRTL